MQANWNQLALPPGWEAKYDQRTAKYFFINHESKTTSWEDPRIAYYQLQPQQQQRQPQQQQYQQPQQQQPQQQQPQHQQRHHQQQQQQQQPQQQQPQQQQPQHQQRHHQQQQQQQQQRQQQQQQQHPARQTQHPKSGSRQNAEEIPLGHLGGGSPKCVSCGVKKVQTHGETCWKCSVEDKYGISFAQPDDEEEQDTSAGSGTADSFVGQSPESSILLSLKHEFPTAGDDLLANLLNSCNNNQDKVFQKLIGMGFQRKGSKAAEPESTSARKTAAARSQSTPQAPSAAEKRNLQIKMYGEFSAVSKEVVDIALESATFSEVKARAILKQMTASSPKQQMQVPKSDEKARKASSSSTPSSAGNTTARKSPSPGRVQAREGSQSPATSSVNSRPSTAVRTVSTASAIAGGSSTTARQTQLSPRITVASTSRKSSAAGSSSSREMTPVARQPVPKPKPTPKKYLPKSYTPELKIPYKSAMCGKANGPAKSLAKGPDRSLLLERQTLAVGANKENVKGPQSNNVQGPMFHVKKDRHVCLAVGHDKSLVVGPNKALLNNIISSH